MTSIFLVADLIDATIEIRKRPGDRAWSCRLDGAEVSADGILTSEFGVGFTPDEALLDYCIKIADKKIVFGAESTTKRRDFTMPADLGV